MLRKFTKKKEDFKCSKCGTEVIGDGWTNHCPNCLWSKHVDINPGDRAEECCGDMEPIGIDIKEGNVRIVHRCVRCQKVTRTRTSEGDNQEKVIQISKLPIKNN